MKPCSVDGCPCYAVAGSDFCSVHEMYTRRESFGVGISCYACGERIRLHSRMVVRVEGAFHARQLCLSMPIAEWATRIIEPAKGL